MFAKTKTYLLLFVAILLSGCDDSYVSSIPDYQVDLNLDLNSSYSTFKNSTGEFLLIENRIFETDRIGYGGIFLYTGLSLDDSNNTMYFAFDMACPYEAKRDVRVYPIEDDLKGFGKVKCEECGSIYDVSYGYGYPIEGPSKEVLKKYNAILISNRYLKIYR